MSIAMPRPPLELREDACPHAAVSDGPTYVTDVSSTRDDAARQEGSCPAPDPRATRLTFHSAVSYGNGV